MPQSKIFRVLLLASLFILLSSLVFFFLRPTSQIPAPEAPIPEFKIVSLHDIQLEIVDIPEKRAQGLSGREELASKQGMLFVFDTPEKAGIWMKDMNFSIDIIWFDEQKKVVYIKEHATPESFPEVFIPSILASFVLEVPTGFIKERGIEVGDTVQW